MKDKEGHGSEGDESKVKISVSRPIGHRIADIGPGGKEHNVKTNAAWDKAEHHGRWNMEAGKDEGRSAPHEGKWTPGSARKRIGGTFGT